MGKERFKALFRSKKDALPSTSCFPSAEHETTSKSVLTTLPIRSEPEVRVVSPSALPSQNAQRHQGTSTQHARPNHNEFVLSKSEVPVWYIQDVKPLPNNHVDYLCATCRHIDLDFIFRRSKPARTAHAKHYIRLGPFPEIAAERSCGLCRIVAATIEERIRLGDKHDWAKLDTDNESLLSANWYLSPFVHKAPPIPTASFLLFLQHSISHEDPPELTPFALRLVTNGYRGGRRVSADELDYSWIRRTTDLCEINTEMPRRNFTHPIRVVDVVDLCIVDLDVKTQKRYVALSYPWGAVQQLTLRIENEVLFRQANGLSKVHMQLARTIQDAIVLTSRVGVRYLWVDSLCIFQDNPGDVKRQIDQMRQIYLHAHFTIFAVSGHDANYGLPGVRPRSRDLKQILQDVSGLTIANALPWASGNECNIARKCGAWDFRAWTFQERFNSQRSLFVGDDGMYMNCMHILSPEDEHCWHPNEQQKGYVNFGHMFFFSGLDSRTVPFLGYGQRTEFDLFAIFVYDYTPRKLTYESDALKAFSGIISHLEDQFDCDMLFGIPEAEFDAGLLWSPIGASVRRPEFPSWSWLGWAGPIAYPWTHERDTFMSTENSPLMWLDADVARDNQDVIAYMAQIDGKEMLLIPENGPRVLQESSETDEAWFTSDDLCLPPSPLRDAWLRRCRKSTGDHLGAREFCRKNKARWRSVDVYREYWPSDVPLPQSYTLQTGQDGDHRLTLKTLAADFLVSGRPFTRGRQYNIRESIHRLTVYDNEGHRAGYIDIPEPDVSNEWSRYLGVQEFIVLSRSTIDGKFEPPPDRLICRRREGIQPEPRTYKSHRFGEKEQVLVSEQSSEYTNQKGCFDRRVYDESRPWCMFNVMMLVRDGEVAYREAIGRIHVDAFLAQEPEMKVVELE